MPKLTEVTPTAITYSLYLICPAIRYLMYLILPHLDALPKFPFDHVDSILNGVNLVFQEM